MTLCFLGEKNIFDVNAAVHVNPVNCVGVMGAGLAKEFKRRYPDMFTQYKLMCDTDALRPGVLDVPRRLTREVQFPQHIVNLPTKVHWKDPSTLENVMLGVVALSDYVLENKVRTVAVPKLGCGLGGLVWKDVCDLIVLHMTLLPCATFVLGDRV